jgi:nucleotide-binding universal stress UspA family protein
MKDFKIKKILVPFDFSEDAANALNTAVAISQQQHASLTLLYVVDNSKALIFGKFETIVSPVVPLTKIARENLNVLAKSLTSKHSFTVDYHIETGIPAFTICRYAWEKDFDMIVMGTRGPLGLKKLLFNSTAYKVVKSSPCPVLSVPSYRLFTRFKKIIFPIRNAPNMLEKYNVIWPIIQENESSLTVAGLTAINDADNYKKVAMLMETIGRRLQRDGIRHSSNIHFCDSISSQLLEISRNENPDLIVIISLVNTHFKRFFLEYYAKCIVDSAPCPVLSIRPDMAVLN